MSIFGTLIERIGDKTVSGINHIFRAFCLSAIAFWMISCGEGRPDDVLSKEEMVRVLEELYIAEEKVNHLALSRDSARHVFEEMGSRVFESAAISDTVFRKSFDYYMERPRELELIYTALVDTLQLREQRAPFSLDHQ